MYIDEQQFYRISKLLEEYDTLGDRITRGIRNQLYQCMKTDLKKVNEKLRNAELPWTVPSTEKNDPDQDWDGCDCEDCSLVEDFCMLTDHLVKDILRLEEAVVHWRTVTAHYLPSDEAEMLRSDALDGLARRYSAMDCDSYEYYLRYMGYTEDPMQCDEHRKSLEKLRHEEHHEDILLGFV